MDDYMDADILTVIAPFCDIETLSRLARTCKVNYSVIRENPIYHQFAKFYNKFCTFSTACEQGYIHIAKWLYSRGAGIHGKKGFLFTQVCTHGHLELAKWLWSLDTGIVVDFVDIPSLCNRVFKLTCESGRLETAQWLLTVCVIDVHESYDSPFRRACEKGHLKVAQWLYNFGNVDVHAKEDYAFREACVMGCIKTAKWLYKLGQFDGYVVNVAFTMACKENHQNIQEWLQGFG
jgi:hypothetical protein